MTSRKILLKQANLITEKGELLLSRDVAVADGIIREVKDGGEIPETDFDQVVDCTGLYVTPGLVNLHCHCAMNIFRGIAEDVNADAWFNERIWPYESKLSAEDVYVGTKLGIAEMLNCGVTTFADHYFEEESVLRAALETGIRVDLAPTIFGSAPDFEERLETVSAFCERNRSISGRVSLRLGPHAPYTCPPDSLKKIVARAKELDLGLHLHVSETSEQVRQSREIYGKTPFAMAAEAGVFERNVLVAHGLWIEEEDFPYLGEETWFAFCPKTYLKLSMGTGLAFRERGRLHYSFGTDGAASSNTLNPCEQARCFAQAGKFLEGDPCDYETREVWKALMNGHHAFPFHSGRPEAGYAADLAIWDLKKPNTWPVYDPLTAILYSSEPSNVAYTMVDGVFLKEQGRLKLDIEALLDEGAMVQKEIVRRGKGQAKVLY
ncbi:MAG: amidohydrolase family protein [Clostridiales bacterium]|nr:amidohydrolase family protein [Clostridiales bacterium]